MLLLLLACADPAPVDPFADLAFAPAGPESAPDPSAWGPFAVGVTTVWLTDPVGTLDDGSPREIPVEVWYPSTQAEGALREYAVADFVPEERLELEGVDAASLPWLASSSIDEGEPDVDHGPYPLVVFSHGNGGMRLQSLFFTELLASHGYVVASPDHIGNTLYDVLIPGEDAFSSTTDALIYRPNDIALVVERLRGSSDLVPVSDGDWGMTGHSLGAWTALRVAGEAEGVAVAVAQAPPEVSLALIGTGTDPDEFDFPVLLQAGDADQILEYEDNALASFEIMAAPSRMATYYDAGHFSFSDLCLVDLGAAQAMITDSVGNVMEDGCGPQNADIATLLPVMNWHAVGLINAALRGSPGSEALMLQGPGGALDEMFELVEAE